MTMFITHNVKDHGFVGSLADQVAAAKQGNVRLTLGNVAFILCNLSVG